jgi:hypothetical protein
MVIPSYPHEYGHFEFYFESVPQPQSQREAGRHEHCSWRKSSENATVIPPAIISCPSIDTVKEKENSIPDNTSATTSKCSSNNKNNRLPQQKRRLPQNYRLSPSTVVLGKGKGPKEASGNLRLKELVSEYLDEYATSGRQGKMAVISRVVGQIQNENANHNQSGPAFVRYEDGHWWEVTEKECRVKVTATFRDFLSDNYRSSSKSKVEYRRRQREERKELSDFETAVMALNTMMKY